MFTSCIQYFTLKFDVILMLIFAFVSPTFVVFLKKKKQTELPFVSIVLKHLVCVFFYYLID